MIFDGRVCEADLRSQSITRGRRSHARATRRPVYRQAKKTLYAILRPHWHGSRASLTRLIRAWLRGKNRGYLSRLVRRHAFTLAVAGALLAGAQAHASSPIDLADVVAGKGGFVIIGSGFSVSGAGDVYESNGFCAGTETYQ